MKQSEKDTVFVADNAHHFYSDRIEASQAIYEKMGYDISTRPYGKDTKLWQVCEATKNNLFEKLHDEDPDILQINLFLVNEFTELLQEKPNPLNPSLKKVVVNTCKPYDDSIKNLGNVLASYGVEMFVYDRKNFSSTMQEPSFFKFLGK